MSATSQPAQAPARFKPGDRVRAKNIHPKSHTRLPRYVRGHVGTVELLHGCHVFPDTVVPRDFDTIVIPLPERGAPQLEPRGARRGRRDGLSPDVPDDAPRGAVT